MTGPDAMASRSANTDAIGRGDIVAEKYRVERVIGRGGMGVVFEAEHLQLEQRIALKVMAPGKRHKPALVARFLREARTVAKLRSHHVCRVYDVGELAGGEPYMVLELLRGRDLDDVLARLGPLPIADAVEYIVQACVGIAEAHAHELVHRDLKPHNLFLTEREDGSPLVKVLDFGVAKGADDFDVTDPAALLGSPSYMAPEQMLSSHVDARADIYALGAILYAFLTGARPFSAESLPLLCAAVLGDPAPPPSRLRPEVTAELDAVVLRCLAKQPGERYVDVAELARALAPFAPERARPTIDAVSRMLELGAVAPPEPPAMEDVAGRTVTASTAPPGPHPDRTAAQTEPLPLRPRARRRRSRRIAAVAIAIAVVGGGAWLALRDSGTAVATTPIDARAARPLTTTGACASAPTFIDDHTVVFDLTTREAVDLYRIDLAGGEPVRLTRDPAWEWRAAPGRSATELLYLRMSLRDPGARGIVARDLATGEDRLLAQVLARAVAAAGDAVFYIREDGTEVRRLSANTNVKFLGSEAGALGQLVTSPDGRSLAVLPDRASSTSIRIGIAEVASGVPRMIALTSPLGSRPAFAADSGTLYYASADGVRRIALAGEPRDELVLEGVRAPGGLAVSPDGRALVWSECRIRSALVDVSMSPPAVVLDEGSRAVALSSFGEVAWIRETTSGSIVMVRTRAGTNVALTDASVGKLTEPAFDPSGDRVAYASGRGLHVVPVTRERPPQPITTRADDRRPIFLADGGIAFQRGETTAPYLHVVDTAGEAERVIDEPRRLHGRNARTGELLLSTTDLMIYTWWNPATREERVGPTMPEDRGPYTAELSPDGRWLLYMTAEFGQRLYRLDLERRDARPESIYTVPPGETMKASLITKDGHPLVALDTWTGELMVAPAGRGQRL